MEQFSELPEMSKISSLKPIEQSAGDVIWTREKIKDIVELPLVKACEHLYDKNIQTISSSANQKDIEQGSAYIEIDYESLSDENKKMANEICEIEEYAGSKKAVIRIALDTNSTVEDIEKQSLSVVERFHKQVMSWVQTFPGDQETAEAGGLFFDHTSGLMYVSEEHYQKSKGVI